MSIIGFRRDEEVYRECRECGRKVESTGDPCPQCGGDIAEYRFPS